MNCIQIYLILLTNNRKFLLYKSYSFLLLRFFSFPFFSHSVFVYLHIFQLPHSIVIIKNDVRSSLNSLLPLPIEICKESSTFAFDVLCDQVEKISQMPIRLMVQHIEYARVNRQTKANVNPAAILDC